MALVVFCSPFVNGFDATGSAEGIALHPMCQRVPWVAKEAMFLGKPHIFLTLEVVFISSSSQNIISGID
jgi:hypothetical protein